MLSRLFRTQNHQWVRLSLALLWLGYLPAYWPVAPQSLEWVHFLLLAAPLLIVPLTQAAVDLRLLLSSVALAAAYWLPVGPVAALLSCLWLAYCLWLMLAGGLRFWQTGIKAADAARLLAYVFLAFGAGWAVLDRAGFQPLSFDPLIVLLTAVHYHFAGFVLTWAAAELIRRGYGGWWLVAGLALAAPAVAAAITFVHYGYALWAETAAGSFMAVMGLIVAGLHLQVVRKEQVVWKAVFVVGIICLGTGMALALLYAWRPLLPLPWLSIPWMYAVHGTLNSLGFSLPVIWAWQAQPTAEPAA